MGSLAALARLSGCLLQELRLAAPEDDSTGSLLRLLKQVTPEQWQSFRSVVEKPAASEEALEELPALRAEARRRREEASRTRQSIWGESWAAKVARCRSASPYSHYASWRLRLAAVWDAQLADLHPFLADHLLCSALLLQNPRCFAAFEQLASGLGVCFVPGTR